MESKEGPPDKDLEDEFDLSDIMYFKPTEGKITLPGGDQIDVGEDNGEPNGIYEISNA